MEIQMNESGIEWSAGSGFDLFVFAIFVFLTIWPFWRIWKRTGHSGWPGLSMIVPGVNIVMIYALAFKSWPIDKTADEEGGKR
ncbi:MAG: hypothetical protein ISN28_05335 [Ectothiorhodospiraceae bacterium AqS1]|nr:hypothetical protein [Ectothiorhodospiraceae bacterium AqS1]